MSIAIGKVLGGIALSGGGIVAITGTTLWLNNSDNDIFIYAISEASADAVSIEIDTTDGQKNYQCKFGSQNHECTIFKITDVDATKKQTNIDDLKKDTTAQAITKSELQSENKIYKINIKSSTGDWSSNAKIEIISTATTGDNVNKKYASLKPLFALTSEYKPDPFTKTKYFVVKSASTGNRDADATSITYKCLTSKEDITSDKNPNEECNIYDVFENSEANKNWHEINFKKPTPKANVKVETNKYYLVELTAEVKVEGVSYIKIQKYVNNTATDVSLKASVLIPTIRDKEDGDNIFILASPVLKKVEAPKAPENSAK